MKYTITDALRSTNESFYISNDDYENLDWKSSEPKPTKEWCENKAKEMQAEYDAQEYARKRQAEYPTTQELVVALYDTDDKADIEAKRAEVKKKYPKPE